MTYRVRASDQLTGSRSIGKRSPIGESDDFWSWRDRMYQAALRIGPEALEAIAACLYAELLARGRDVIEHIERVVHHVRRLETSAEAAVQLHFSAQTHRANEIMRTLTAVTAVFLPLNLITGFFGMNFEFMPMVHTSTGFWWVVGLMVAMLVLLLAFFWRKRYLATSR